MHHRQTPRCWTSLHLDLDPRRPVAGLGVAQQQMVEIAKALSLDAKLLIIDKPTSALTGTEIKAALQRDTTPQRQASRWYSSRTS